MKLLNFIIYSFSKNKKYGIIRKVKKKEVINMRCPRCHNENKYDALSCDFCMAPLPMTEERAKEIKEKKKLEKAAKLEKSLTKLFGLLIGVAIIIGIVIAAYFIKK